MKQLLHGSLALALFTTAMTSTLAQVDRTRAPQPGPAPKVNIAAHTTYNLPNGMRVIVVENHKLPLVSMQVKFDIDPFTQGDKAGYADLCGDLLGSGTVNWTKEQIDQKVDALGASLNTAPDGLYATCLTKNFNQIFQLAFEITTSATFPQEEFDKAKTRMLSGLKSKADDPDAISEQVGRMLTFGKSHPYGEIVTEASVAKLDQPDVWAYYKRFFIPSRCYLVLVGDITEKQAQALTDGTFAPWVEEPAPTTAGVDGVPMDARLGAIRTLGKTAMPNGPRRVAIVDKPGAAQSVIRVVWPLALKASDPQALSAQVMNTVLGGGVFNARLMQNLRERKGYTYGAYSELSSDRWNGSFNAGCSVRTEVTDSAVTELMFELDNMRENAIAPDELDLAKNYMAGSFARSLEDPRTVARFALNTYLDHLAHDHYSTWLTRLDTVSTATVMAAARDYLAPDNAVILVVGDKEKIMSKLAALSANGVVEVYDMNGAMVRDMPRPVPPGTTVQSVIDKYINACGGAKAIANLKDVTIVSSGAVQGMPVTLTQWYSKPGRYASEMKSGAMMMERMVCNGERAKNTSMMGAKELVDQELNDVKQNATPFPELKYTEYRHGLALGGLTDIDGKPCVRLIVTPENATSFTEYYDAATGFKVRRVENRRSEEGTMSITTDYADYRAVSGVFFPYSIKQNVGIEIAFAVTEVVVNKGVDAAVFEME